MTVEIGELRARLTAESQQMRQEVQAVKKEFQDLGDQGKKTSDNFKVLDSAITQVASSKEKLATLTATLDNVNARIELQRKKLAELKESFDNAFSEKTKSKLEEQILRTESTLLKLTQTSDNTAKKMWELEDSINQASTVSQKAAAEFDSLDNALKEIGLNSDQIKSIKKNLDSADPTRLDRQLDEVSATLKKLGVDSQQIEKITKELREAETESNKAKQGINGLASGIAALGAGATLSKLVSVVKTLSSEANGLYNSYKGLAGVSKSFNVDTEKSIELADKLADRWGADKGIIADTVKTYLSLNLSLEETEKIMIGSADAAAYNRKEHLSLEEAINQVAQGIKSGNSHLTDAAGITTNLSVMQDRYAKSIGTTAAKLTEAQKIQAAYNGMLEEGAIFAGNADEAMAGYTGTQATFNQTISDARTELGESFIPVLEQILEMLTPLIRDFGLWAGANHETVAGLTAAAIAVTAFIAVVGALTAAIVMLNAAMGPIGWVLLGIGSVVAGFAAYEFAAYAAADATWKFANSQEELNRKLNESPLTRSSDDLKDLKSDYADLNDLLERRKLIMEELVEADKAVRDGFFATDEEIEKSRALQEQIEQIDKRLKALGLTATTAEYTLGKMKDQIDASTSALRDLYNENLREIDALEKGAKEAGKLADRYNKLTSEAKLTKQQSEELTTVVKKLTERYPSLHTEMDEQGRLLIVNESLIRDLISAETESVDTMLAGERAKREALLATAQAALDSAQAQLKAIEAVATAYQQDIELPDLPSNVNGGSMELRRKFAVGSAADAIAANYKLDGARALVADRQAEIEKLKNDLNVFDANWRELILDNGRNGEMMTEDKKKKKTKTKKAKTKAELQQEEYQESLKYIEYKKNLNQMSEEQELAALQRLEQKYKDNADIRKDLEVRVYQLKDQMYKKEYSESLKLINYKRELGQMSEKQELARLQNMQQKYKDNKDLQEELELKIYKLKEQIAQKDFKNSSEWITQEERKMTLAGASEEAITKMKLEAWTRVRNRYEKDSEFYKQADTQVYNLKVAQMKALAKAEEEAAKEREKLSKENTDKALKAIDKAKKAELDALSDRRKAIQKFYADQEKLIDDSERLKERNELEAEMDKYRYATSEKGQKHFLELQEKLRLMDVEDQKRSLEEERDQKLEALEDQKRDIESWYDELKESTGNLTADLSKLYKLADDERLRSFITTNAKIIEEMNRLKASMAGVSDSDTSAVSQMIANSAEWNGGTPERRKELEAQNQMLGTSIGATYNSSKGRWMKADGTPLYHTGGIAGEMNFRSGDDLMPDEINAILKRGEPVLTPQQVASLVSSGSNNQPASVVNNYNAPLIEHSGDIILEDQADIKSYHSEQSTVAQQLLAKGERAV